mmetsp:Transcript_10702/g.22983  ORF Transcript_10702/g.22983 Transcript_10702/m.22983 type:complete len:731 (-) Transcript_10702:272-2464(-)|eukprot:CAMPEP_0183722054 /NCGR_PEP_ID=MMETSP0737-20130205/14122_1 /TAXON_ID=385413 /ORGANISM="Thalassiosira miniscula, Strain CCMP1093" /LENGTH=730 /DNA_ID=CAMNT_0025952147 /DNA_START=373 /DNA_END=2565 /DNA_ORIENTATION=+
MSTSIIDFDNEKMPLLLGLGVIVIILIAFFSKGEEGGKKKADPPTTSGASKKSKKKKSASKAKAAPAAAPAASAAAPAAEKKSKKGKKKVSTKEAPVAKPEPEPTPEPEAEASKTSKKKKKKKSKKKGGAATAAASASSDENKKVAFKSDDSDGESDDDVELWRIQSASKRKGANDAVKRAAANKERDRVRALKRQEEKAKAETKAAAEAKAAADAEALARKAEEDAAMQAALEAEAAEAKKKAEAEAKKKNGASVANGGNEEAAPTGEKKKRKRKKKKNGVGAIEESRPPLVKPAAAVEHWETVPKVEEWQEVNTKRSKNKAKLEAAAVAAAEAEAEAFLTDEPVAEEPGETSVTIAAGDDPLIFIGKGGSTIQNLQDTTGARFNLNRKANELTISGPEDCVQLGLAEAQAILAIEAERKANEAEERVTWGSDAIKAVIGKGGANIRATQEATGVRIDADVDAGTLVIVGPSDQVSTALTMCHNAAFGEVQDVIELGSRNAVNLVYGPSFQTIRELQDTTGCKLDITRGSTTLKLAGSSEAVAEATEQIRALLEANRGFEMTIENSKVGAVYGKGGETLRSIQDRTGTQIDVSRGPTHATVSVMGTVEASGRARNMLQRAIDGEVELQPGEVADEVELGSATSAVIGRGGSKVAELEKRHGVKINVRSELQKARVVGKPDKVEAAVKDINAIAQPILEAEKAQKKADEALETGESAWAVDAGDDDADGW